MPPEKHLTPEDLAERQGVSKLTVYQWNSTGEGPLFMKVGRHVRYRLADVLAWEKAKAEKVAAARAAKAAAKASA